MEIAVVGTGDSILGFNLAGVKKSYKVGAGEELVNKINEVMADPNVGILVLDQKDYKHIPKRLQGILADSHRPTVISIGTEQSTEMKEKIKRAIGVDLWK